MEINKLRLGGIPTLIWGKQSDRMIIAAHGSHSSKLDDCIWTLAEAAVVKGYQVLSFDLPQHGERVYETEPLMPGECARELNAMYAYAKENAASVSIFGCSMGAYFELLAYANADIDRAWFLSPVLDMERLIRGIMDNCRITEEELRKRVRVDNDIEPLYYPYYEYVAAHPITDWKHTTHILRGENDTVCDYASTKDFAVRFGCELTEQPGGEHWFHTEGQLELFRRWLEERLS